MFVNYVGVVKSKNLLYSVIPAKTRRGGSFQPFSAMADFHGSDGILDPFLPANWEKNHI
jgi:hypothetical protein